MTGRGGMSDCGETCRPRRVISHRGVTLVALLQISSSQQQPPSRASAAAMVTRLLAGSLYFTLLIRDLSQQRGLGHQWE